MQTDQSAKQLVIERVKKATNILVTVSRDPSVDELSAALALTLMLNKLDKHATAVFSGQVPSVLDFLKPEKTFESTVDSLRDFIIALDKEKADRLRYKVEDDVVRIFITPYRTIISDKDLDFSQGDFNVELIVALGVDKKDDLDKAITAHGRILHDASVVTINATEKKHDLDGINWSDDKASSLSEMLMSLSEALQSGLLDEQIASALLTGIVAATDRFRNEHTTPKVMTMAAQLMAAGANQQLIAAKLEEGHQLSAEQASTHIDGSTHLNEGESKKLDRNDKPPTEPVETKPDDGTVGEMQIDHPVEAKPPSRASESSKPEANQDELDAKQEALSSFADRPVAPTLSVQDLKKDIENATRELTAAADQPIDQSAPDDKPTFAATFNATTDAAAEEKRAREMQNRSHRLLSHDSGSSSMAASGGTAAINSVSSSADEEPPSVDPFADTPVTAKAPGISSPEPAAAPPTIAELEEQAHATAPAVDEQVSSVDDARAAVSAALESDAEPAHRPAASLGAQPMNYEETPVNGPVVGPTPNVQPAAAPPQPPTPAASLPPLPDFSTLPPLPGTDVGPDSTQVVTPPTPPLPGEPAPQPPEAPTENDPSQFKLPGQG